MILNSSEIPIYYSPAAQALGVVRDERIFGEALISLIRLVRRTKKKQSGSVEIPRGPIGEGTRHLAVKITPLEKSDLLLILLLDDSEAERVDAIRRDFVANISHELKTPIGALTILSEAILGESDDPSEVKKFAQLMQTEAKRLSGLVQEIINLSRLQDADPLLDAISVDVDDVVDAAISQCQFNADNRKIELVRGGLANCSVVGDRNQLIMAMHNLIDNAVNYSSENTKVTVSTTLKDGLVEITVVDQGIGIADADLDRIFERFYRVDPARSRATGGTGLGLSIVKHVARIHGGDVSVWSSSGVGSTFSFRLPQGANEINRGEQK
jgi:two-component system sensor histidine kinase SenX3